MADKKISALTGATTPLAGTEVLPIVQGGATVNVSVANLTAGRAPSVSGLTVSGLTASTAVALNASKELVSVTNTGTGNNVLATAPTLVGDVSLSTGNLVVSNGKGIDFSLTPGTGTSELFNDYEEGAFTATIRGGTTDPSTPQTGTGYYTKIGRQVTVLLSIDDFDTTGASGQIQISGMPFTAQAGIPRTVGQMYFSRAANSPIMSLIEPSGTLLKAVDAQGNSVNYNSAGASTYTSVSITYIV